MNGSFYLHDILSYDSGNTTKSCFWCAKLKAFTIYMRRWYGCHFITFGTKALELIFEPVHEITNNMVCATSKASDQPAQTRSLIRAFASRLSIL